MIDTLKSLIKQFMPFAQEQMGFNRPPKLFLKQDKENAANPMGKTGYYDPASEAITLFVTGRHPKDIMRSLSHELMHHTQNCNGEFDKVSSMGEQGYAQNDPHLRTMEIEAYKASIVFRDWEDSCKGTIYYEHLQKGDNKMSTKDWKNKEMTQLLSEAWGFKFNTLEEFEQFNGTGELQAEDAEVEGSLEEELEEVAASSGRGDPQRRDRRGDDERKRPMPMEEAHCVGKRDEPCGKDDCPKCGGKRKNEAAENDGETLEEEGELDEAKKGKYDDGDGKDEKCDHVPCEDQDKKPTKEQIEALVKKALQEALLKRKK